MEWNGHKEYQSTKWQETQKCGSNEVSISNLTSGSLEPGVWNIDISTKHSYRREPEPMVITDDVTNTQTPEKGRPSSDNKMNNSQNKYIWINTNEGGPHEVTWEVNFWRTLTTSGKLRVHETLNQQINWCRTFQNLQENNKWNDQTK
jgi:hypothetical protein